VKKLSLLVVAILAFAFFPNFTLLENQPVHVTLNGRPLFNAVVIQGGTQPGAAPGAQSSIIAVLLKDFLTVSGAGITMQPAFELRGNALWATGKANSTMKIKQDGTLVPAVQQKAYKWAPGQLIAAQKAGRIGTLINVNGQNYLALQDVQNAFFGDGSVHTLGGGVRPGGTLNLMGSSNGILIGLNQQ
jgi:hypothetical protein